MQSKQITAKMLRAIFATGILSFCGVVVETAMNITFPTLMKEFNVTTNTVQWMTTSYLLILAIIIPLSAILKRKFKTRQLFLAANLLFTSGLIIDSAAPNFILLLTGRLIQGVGTGIALPLMFNIILEQVPQQKLGQMMGLGNLITAVAPAIGPSLGGLIISYLGWRYIFLLLLPLLILSFFLGITSIEQKYQLQQTSIDWPSFLLIISMFTTLILGLNGLGSHSFFSLPVLGLISIGILSCLALFIRSISIKAPIIQLNILKNRLFSGHLLAFFIFQMAVLSLAFTLPNYLQLVNHRTPSLSGMITFPGAILGACLAPFGGKILDKLGARKPILTGTSFSFIALLLFNLFASRLNFLLMTVFYLIFMAGIGLGFGNIMTSALKQLSLLERADGNALLTTLQQFAGAVGTSSAAAFIAQSQAIIDQPAAALTTGSQKVFIFLLILNLLQSLILFKVVKK